MSFLSYSESIKLLNEINLPTNLSEKVYLSDSLGRVLAKDIIATESYPAYPTASMDGYAIKFDDQRLKEIKISGDNPAGSDIAQSISDGVCIKTFTGSLMPDGADTLIPIENVTVDGSFIKINEEVDFGFSVREVGESYDKGDILIKKGTTISFVEIGVLAGLNYVHVNVKVRPKVAVLSTGSELLEVGETATNRAQIRSSNNYTIEALAKQAGADVIQLGVVGDDRDKIEKAFKNALSVADIVVSTGGVSVGDYDFVKDLIPALGAEVVYKGVKIKPGQHILVATYSEKAILALPGFAYSSTITFLLYGLPLIYRFLDKNSSFEMVDAVLTEPFKKRSKKSEFTTCNLNYVDGRYEVNFRGKKVGSSAILNNLLGAALLVTDEDDTDKKSGESVKVIRLDRL